MNRPHPNQRWIALAALPIALSVIPGCSNQQVAASNPFLAPDRVPPPATRAAAPTGVPQYYPGAPLPTSALSAPPAPTVAAVTSPQTAAAPQITASAPTTSLPAQPTSFSNERTVAIPSDNSDLRFAVTQPPPPTSTMPQPVQQVAAAAPPPQQVATAVYSEPQPVGAVLTTPPAPSDGPWRSPQVAQSQSQVTPAQYAQPQGGQMVPVAQPPTTLPVTPTTAMPVEMRAVPAPAAPPTISSAAPAQSVGNPPPRMQFPSIWSPSTWFSTQPAENQQLVGYMVPGPNGQMQMVPVDQYQGATASQPVPSVAGSDGFRPRGTTKQ